MTGSVGGSTRWSEAEAHAARIRISGHVPLASDGSDGVPRRKTASAAADESMMSPIRTCHHRSYLSVCGHQVVSVASDSGPVAAMHICAASPAGISAGGCRITLIEAAYTLPPDCKTNRGALSDAADLGCAKAKHKRVQKPPARAASDTRPCRRAALSSHPAIALARPARERPRQEACKQAHAPAEAHACVRRAQQKLTALRQSRQGSLAAA